MKTAMQELIDDMYDYKRSTFCDKLVMTFWIIKAEKLIQKEKEQIINACNYGLEKFGNISDDYFNKTYNNNK